MTAREGQTLGPYRLERLLGRGGMGEVYLAFDTVRGREVALKLLPPQLAADAGYAARFRSEAQLAARLQEPHIVPIHDFGAIGDELFIDMRLVQGSDLRTILDRQGRLDPDRALLILGQIAAALDAAHADGLVHRDVKPENILVTGGDFAYLADFGIAHRTGAGHLTEVGQAIGSFRYMAPERFADQEVTGAADIYSLGCVLFECLTGEPPFPGSDLSRLMRAHVLDPPPQLPNDPRLPVGLTQVLQRAMAKEPADRYPSAREFAADGAATLTRGDAATVVTSLRNLQAPVPGPDDRTELRQLPAEVPSAGRVPTAATQAAVVPGLAGDQGKPRDKDRRGGLVVLAACVAAVLAVAAVGAYLVFGSRGADAKTAAGGQTSTTGPAAPSGPHNGATTTSSAPTAPLRVGITNVPSGGDSSTGFNGFDASVANYVAQQLHYPSVQFVPARDYARITDLSNGTVDMVVSTFTMSADRANLVTFAGPYFTAHLGVMVKTDSPAYSLTDLANSTICLSPGTAESNALSQADPSVSFTQGASLPDCLRQVKAGTADGALMDDSILAAYLTKTDYAGQVRLIETGLGQQSYGIGLPHGATAMCTKVNAALRQMVSSGAWQTALSQNFPGGGFSPSPPSLQEC